MNGSERQKWARHRERRGRRQRKGDSYARGDGAGGRLHNNTLSGTARHIRCDRCLRDYLPQHVQRIGKWRWECGNCLVEQGHGYTLQPRYMLRRELVAA